MARSVGTTSHWATVNGFPSMHSYHRVIPLCNLKHPRHPPTLRLRYAAYSFYS